MLFRSIAFFGGLSWNTTIKDYSGGFINFAQEFAATQKGNPIRMSVTLDNGTNEITPFKVSSSDISYKSIVAGSGSVLVPGNFSVGSNTYFNGKVGIGQTEPTSLLEVKSKNTYGVSPDNNQNITLIAPSDGLPGFGVYGIGGPEEATSANNFHCGGFSTARYRGTTRKYSTKNGDYIGYFGANAWNANVNLYSDSYIQFIQNSPPMQSGSSIKVHVVVNNLGSPVIGLIVYRMKVMLRQLQRQQ